MKSRLSSVLGLSLVAFAVSCGGANTPVVAPGAAAPVGSTFVGSKALPGMPENVFLLARAHGVESAYKLVHGWLEAGPADLQQTGEEMWKAVDLEQGAAMLVTADKGADLDKVIAGEQPIPLHGLAVVAVRDLEALKDFTAGATEIAPGRKRFLDKTESEIRSKLQCDVQTSSVPNHGLVVCGDEAAMRDLYAVATTTVMQLRPKAQLHIELHKDNAEPLFTQAMGKLKSFASMMPSGAETMAMYEDSFASMADLSEFVIDTSVDAQSMQIGFSEQFSTQNSELVKTLFAPSANHAALQVLQQLPADIFSASYSEKANFKQLKAALPAIKKALADAGASRDKKDESLFLAGFETIAARLAESSQIAFAGGVEGSLIRAFVGKAADHESDKSKAEVRALDFPAYAMFWHDGNAWLLPGDVAAIKKAMKSSGKGKAADKDAPKRAPDAVELVPAKALPAELAQGTVVLFREGKKLAASPKKGAPKADAKKDEPFEMYVAEVPFMGGRALLVGLNLNTLATALRRTLAPGQKVANLGVFKERAGAEELAFGYVRTDLLTPFGRIAEAGAKDKTASLLMSVMSLMDTVEAAPKAEVTELVTALKGKSVRMNWRIPAAVFVDSGRLVRAMEHGGLKGLDPDKQL